MACDDGIIPLQERLESAVDESDLEKVYQTERHLFYVACTRARDRLLVTGVNPASEFLDDLSEKIQLKPSLTKGVQYKSQLKPSLTKRGAVQLWGKRWFFKNLFT